VSGNVSLYNETNGAGILPTPAIGGVGLIDDVTKAVQLAFPAPDQAILLVGETRGHLGSTLYLREIEGREDGEAPPVDLTAERRNGDFVRARIAAGDVTSCHDVSDGGLLVAIAEMAMAGGIGADLAKLSTGDVPAHAFLFGEDQARYLVTTTDVAAFLEAATIAGVPVQWLGTTGGTALTLPGGDAISTAELKRVNTAWLPDYMAGRTPANSATDNNGSR
jgi:phosphoribosylformylglycinamidine synthase